MLEFYFVQQGLAYTPAEADSNNRLQIGAMSMDVAVGQFCFTDATNTVKKYS